LRDQTVRPVIAAVDGGSACGSRFGTWGPVECGQLKRLRSPGRYSLLKWCVIPDWTNSIRRFARSSAACCSAAVTMVASGPGYTVATWSLSNQRTMYGGEPSAECTSVISPRCSGWSMVKPFITRQSPTLASIANTPSIHPAIVATYGSLRGRAALPRVDGRKSHAGLTTSSEVSGQTAADNDQRNAHRPRRGVLSRLPRRVFAPVTRSRARSRTRSTFLEGHCMPLRWHGCC
jgi:hypothetical protein